MLHLPNDSCLWHQDAFMEFEACIRGTFFSPFPACEGPHGHMDSWFILETSQIRQTFLGKATTVFLKLLNTSRGIIVHKILEEFTLCFA